MARPDKIQDQPRPVRLYTYVTEEEEKRIKEAANQAGIKVSVFLRKVALAQQIRPARSRQAQDLIAVLNTLGASLNRVGNNVNQLAHQANASGYDIERAKLEGTLDELHAALQGIIGAIKKV